MITHLKIWTWVWLYTNTLVRKSNKMSDSGLTYIELLYGIYVPTYPCMFYPGTFTLQVAVFSVPLTTGTNSTVAAELHIAGVVISSLGLVLPFLVTVILAAMGCIVCTFACIGALYCAEDVKEWMAEVRDRRQETRG